MNNIYMFKIVAQHGNGPIYSAGNHVADSEVGPDMDNLLWPGRETNLISAQAFALMAVLLKHVPITQRQFLGLFFGTHFGSLEDDRLFQKSRIADGGKFASPAAFRRTLPSTLPAELSIAFGMQGSLITYADRNSPTMIAIIRACQWIATGAITCAVAGSFDFLLTGGNLSTAASPTYRTVLCLIATREMFPELNVWAVITQAAIEATSQSTTNTEAGPDETDFGEIIAAIADPNLTILNLHRQSGMGNRYRLVMRVSHR